MTAMQAAGFIGLGAMGGAIAGRMAEGGAPLHVFDPSPAACARLEALGAAVHPSPRSVADAAEVVFACLPAGEISRRVALGPDGVADGTAVRIHVELSTIGKQTVVAIAEGLKARGIATVDCPISGGPKGAMEGTLATMMAGERAAMERVKPYMGLVGPKIFEVGETPGHAQVMKLVNNLISAANMAGAFEALVFGAKAGLDPDTMVEIVNAGTGRNTATDSKVPRAVLPGTFDYGARLAIMYKDITLGLDEAEAEGVPMWTLGAVGQLFRYGMTQGRGDEDYTALIRCVEEWAGAEVRSRRS